MGNRVLSARVPFPRLRLARPSLTLGAELPGDGDNGRHDDTGNDRVSLPVRRLSVPATGRRPDVLGVPLRRDSLGAGFQQGSVAEYLRDFSTTALVVGLAQ